MHDRYLHTVIEVLRIAFADGNWWIADPAHAADSSSKRTASLLSPAYLSERAKLFNPKHTIPPSQLSHGTPNSTSPSSSSPPFPSPAHQFSDTVYFAITDPAGNAISFINSNFGGFSTPEDPAGNGFGSCIVPKDCGFVLQNRGAKFSLHPPEHPNILAPRKRPYHTIIPGMVTEPAGSRILPTSSYAATTKDLKDAEEPIDSAGKMKRTKRTKRTRRDQGFNNDANQNTKIPTSAPKSPQPERSTITPTSTPTGPLHSTFGIMGGYMQPQGQVQLLLNQLIFRHDPQTALDAPRICVGAPMPDSQGRASIDVTDAEQKTKNSVAPTAASTSPDATSGPVIFIEHGISEAVVAQLKEMGHRNVRMVGAEDGGKSWLGRSVFGRGQIIRCGVDEQDEQDERSRNESYDDDDENNGKGSSDNDDDDDDDENNDIDDINNISTTRKRKRKSRPAPKSPAEPSNQENKASKSIERLKKMKMKKKRKWLVYSAGSDARGDGAAIPL